MAKLKLHFQRFEIKYYLPKSKADKLIPALLNHLNWDQNVIQTGRDYYNVNSLYFDSPDYGCFWDKEAGVKDRKKLRMRYYQPITSDDAQVFVEIKRKKNALVVKDRIKLEAKDCTSRTFDLTLKNLYHNNSEDDFLKELIWFKNRNALRPVIFITYKRKAFVGKKDKQFRVTFDYDIMTSPAKDLNNISTNFRPVYPGGVVLELKFNNILPAWFHRLIQKYQLNQLAYSKYCNSLRKIIPQLDDNNYLVN